MKPRARIHRLAFVACAILLSAGLTWALKTPDRPLRDYDIAGGLRLGLRAGSLPSDSGSQSSPAGPLDRLGSTDPYQLTMKEAGLISPAEKIVLS